MRADRDNYDILFLGLLERNDIFRLKSPSFCNYKILFSFIPCFSFIYEIER